MKIFIKKVWEFLSFYIIIFLVSSYIVKVLLSPLFLFSCLVLLQLWVSFIFVFILLSLYPAEILLSWQLLKIWVLLLLFFFQLIESSLLVNFYLAEYLVSKFILFGSIFFFSHFNISGSLCNLTMHVLFNNLSQHFFFTFFGCCFFFVFPVEVA